MMRALGVLFFAASVMAGTAVRAGELPRPDHVVIVIEENHAYGQIIGNADAPYINALAGRGTLFTRSYGVAHPSQPNYLALFSGSTHGYHSDVCPIFVSGDNLAGLLAEKGLTFATYSESQPARGDLSCAAGPYRRKHNPAANWSGLQDMLLPFRDFPREFDRLPTVSLVVPDQRHDMHDGSIADGDAWLKANIDAYAQWAAAHNSLLIVTWDEDDSAHDNRIATIFQGAMVRRGSSAQRINHYAVLRTLEDMYGLRRINESADAKPVSGVWRVPGAAKK